MADSPGTGISILQILSVPALLAAITGVGSFLKSLWDKWSERRSLIGLQKLTDYLDLDSKRDTPLLTRQTRELIDYEVNLKFREFAGTPAYDAVERVERWRRRPYLVRGMWIPPEIRKQSGLTLILSKGSEAKPSKNIKINGVALRLAILSYGISLIAVYLSKLTDATLIVGNVRLKHGGGVAPARDSQSGFYVTLLFGVVVTSFVVFSIWAKLLANADRSAREFVKNNGEQEMAYAIDDC